MFPVDSKILMIDDSSFARGMLKNALKELKYWKILEAKDAKSAQSLMKEPEQKKDPIHLIITDIHMPEVNGLEFLRWVRAQPDFKSIPVIVLTSSQEKTEILEAGKVGVSHYIVKPFDAKILGDKMATTWQKHGQKYFESLKAAN